MKKIDRQKEILNLVNKRGTIRVSEVVKILGVTDMTVRRDLIEMEAQGLLKKIHGGARSNNAYQYIEISHDEKHTYNIEAKEYIAKIASELIEEGDTIFLGPGTTVECLAFMIKNKKVRIITNCLPVFNILSEKKTDLFQVFLIGGEKRNLTETFVGEITYMILNKMHFTKAFFGANAVKGNDIMTSSYEEGFTQSIALENSLEKYLLIDSSKIDKEDFVSFFKLSDITAVITNENDKNKVDEITRLTEIINN